MTVDLMWLFICADCEKYNDGINADNLCDDCGYCGFHCRCESAVI